MFSSTLIKHETCGTQCIRYYILHATNYIITLRERPKSVDQRKNRYKKGFKVQCLTQQNGVISTHSRLN